MKITLDTNIIFQDFWMETPHFKVFLDGLSLIPATLHIPEVVIDETVNKFKEVLTEKASEQRKIHSELSRLLKKNTSPEHVNVDKAVKEYSKHIEEKLKTVQCQILPYPKVDHKRVVKRILERRKPFRKGDAGYRDYLIWETIRPLELWGTEKIVFITNNTKDFGEGPFLSEEFIDKTTGNKNFSLCVAISKFNEEYIIPRLKKLENLKQELSKGKLQNFNFQEWLERDFLQLLKDENLCEVFTGLMDSRASFGLDEILLFNDYKIEEVREMESGDKFIKFYVDCEVDAYVDISWDNYVLHKEVREYYGEGAPEEFGFTTSKISANLKAKGYLILDQNDLSIAAAELTYLEGPKGTIDSE